MIARAMGVWSGNKKAKQKQNLKEIWTMEPMIKNGSHSMDGEAHAAKRKKLNNKGEENKILAFACRASSHLHCKQLREENHQPDDSLGE